MIILCVASEVLLTLINHRAQIRARCLPELRFTFPISQETMHAVRSSLISALTAVALTAPTLVQAQAAARPDQRCTSTGVGGDACQKALELFNYLNPQFGMLLAGGNATLGQGGTLGGLGRFALTLRVNAADQLAVPELDAIDYQEGAPQRSSYTTAAQIEGFPVADVAVGLYKGFPVGGPGWVVWTRW